MNVEPIELFRERLAKHQAHLRRSCEDMRPANYRMTVAESSPNPKIFSDALRYLDEDDAKPGAYLFGPPRSGKTACAWQIVEAWRLENERLDDPKLDFAFVDSVTLIRKAKARHLSSEAKEEFDQVFQPLLDRGIAVLDDLGTEKLSESAEEIVYEVINYRTAHLMRTVITSNLRTSELAKKFQNSKEKVVARIHEFFMPFQFANSKSA